MTGTVAICRYLGGTVYDVMLGAPRIMTLEDGDDDPGLVGGTVAAVSTSKPAMPSSRKGRRRRVIRQPLYASSSPAQPFATVSATFRMRSIRMWPQCW